MEDKVLEAMGLTQSEFDEMTQYVEEYEEIDNKLDELMGLYGVKDKELLDIVESMKCFFTDNAEYDYNKYKEIIEEYENFDWDNYDENPNEGIWEHVLEERRRGF